LPIVAALFAIALTGCDMSQEQPKSASGVSQAQVNVPTGSDGLTTEQRNVKDRLVMDNKPGSIKHLYIISPETGQVLIYSTVKGKVTSSGKRLTPRTVDPVNGSAISVNIGGSSQRTTEVLEDDGTYGTSVDYIF